MKTTESDPAGMTLAEAYRVAVLITDRRRNLTVIAIGHFLPPEEITPFTPWAVSVLDSTSGRMSVIRDAAEIEAGPTGETKPLPKPTTKPAAKSKPVPMSLFD